VWGGLRIGWLRTEAALAAELGATLARRQLSVGLLDQLAATVLVEQLDEVLDQRRAQLRRRRDALLAEITRVLPDWEVHPPAGGLSVWCRLPAGVSSTALAVGAAAQGVLLAEGRAFGTGHAFDDRLRLPFTRPADELRRAVEVIAQVQSRLRSGAAPTASAQPLTVV
jgi:DNA-binding transcriptional MocR family regulator